MRRTADPPRADRGQAAIELALALPLLALLLLAIVQLVVVVRDQLAVVHAAREGARAAAVSSAPDGDGAAAARGATSLTPLEVSVGHTNGSAAVTVRYQSRTDVPLIGAVLPDINVESTATMRDEP
ncbi:MAG: TadE family type IV pilus minor pilin [Ilumatobacteraceae bacterium]